MTKLFKLRKWIAVPVLAVMIAFAPVRSDASAGAIFGLTAAMIGGLLIAGAACNYYKPGSGSTYRTNPYGVVTVSLLAGWYSVNQFMQSLWLGKNVTAKIDYEDVKNITKSNPGRYPNLENALKGKPFPITKDSQPGDIVQVPGYGNNKITHTSTSNPACQFTSNFGTTVYAPERTSILVAGGNAQGCTGSKASGYWLYLWHNSTSELPPGTPSSYATKLANEEAEILAAQDIYSDRYGNEIDDFIKDNPNVIDMVDTVNPDETDAPPFIPPVGAQPLPGEGTKTVTGLGAEEAARAAEAAQAARGNLEAAKQAAQNARDALAQDPTNEDLKRLLEIAEAAQIAAEKALEAAEKLAAEKAAEAEEVYPSPPGGDMKKLSFDKWRQLLAVLETVWPFSLLVGLAAKYGQFVSGDPVAPVFHIPMPLGNDLVINLAPLDPIAQMTRYTIAVLLVIGVTWAIVRFYRGVS